jgi:type IV secretory pathway VirB2 component (pilin)
MQSVASTTPGSNDGQTFFDGFLSVWQQVGSNWTLVAENDNAPRTGAGNTGGTTVYGQNVLGFVPAQPASGFADPGLTVNLLANTHYMLVSSAGNSGSVGNQDVPTLNIGQSVAVGTPLQNFFTGKDDQSGGTGEAYSWTNNYTLTITGNVSQIAAPVATVPVPGAVWLFGSVLAGFGVMKRKQA